ncbi:type II 3-dehydroquinate dehydratase [Oceanotoga teriensis]|uniref:type II 3-dehydroquinate dehydratase n=1 Tax=Oceanotoga teriensis TaxID=515440 RepID=UPI0034E29930
MMILIINGPNLNMLGKRNKNIYGINTYEELFESLKIWGLKNEIKLEIFQTNHEGKIIDRIQKDDFQGLIINAGAYSHYSYAISDALEIIKKIKIEVHISNIYAREEFRHNSVISKNCNGVISGMGFDGYFMALDHIKKVLKGDF